MRFNDTTKENIKKELSTKKGLDDARNLLDGNNEDERLDLVKEIKNQAESYHGYKPSDEYVYFHDGEFGSMNKKEMIFDLVGETNALDWDMDEKEYAQFKKELNEKSTEDLLEFYKEVKGYEEILKTELNTVEGLKKISGSSNIIKDEENHDEDISRLCHLLGEAHDKIMEALDLCEQLENENVVDYSLRYAIEDLESEASELDYMGENNPVEHLMEKYHPDEDEETYDPDDDWDM